MDMNDSFFDKSFDTIVKVLPIPNIAEDAIIGLKNFLTEDEVKEWIKNFIDKALNKDGKIISNISEIKEVSKTEGVTKGVSKAIDIILNNAQKSKLIDKNTKNLLNDSKEVIVNKMDKDLEKNPFIGQEDILCKINEKFNLWEEYLKELDTRNMIKTQTEIMKEYSKLSPTIEILNKINEMNNLYELAKNKISNGENVITDLEKEICRKVG